MSTRTNADTPGLAQLRTMVQAAMLEKGGGLIPQTLTAAADEIGCSYISLRQFLHGGGLHASMCIRLAHYLAQPRAHILTLAGFADLVALLADNPPPAKSPYTHEIDKLLSKLPPDKQAAVMASIRAMVKAVA